MLSDKAQLGHRLWLTVCCNIPGLKPTPIKKASWELSPTWATAPLPPSKFLKNCNCWQVDSTYRAIKMHCKSLTLSCQTWALNGNFTPGWKAVHYCPLLLKVSTCSPSCDVTVYWHTKQYTWALLQQSEKRSTKKRFRQDLHNRTTNISLVYCTWPHPAVKLCVKTNSRLVQRCLSP